MGVRLAQARHPYRADIWLNRAMMSSLISLTSRPYLAHQGILNYHELWYNHSELDLFCLMPKLMPTIFTINGYRFSFYSSDCAERMHVHVTKGGHQAKFWIEPTIELFRTFGYRILRRRVTETTHDHRHPPHPFCRVARLCRNP